MAKNIVFQTGGKHGLTWQIVSCWTGPNSTDEILFVGRRVEEGESIKDPPADMLAEMERVLAERSDGQRGDGK